MSGTVLIVEDEPMIQILLEDICEIADVKIVEMIDTVDDALRAIEQGGFNAVILDVNLQGETSEAVAEILGTMNLPVIVSTGSYSGQLADVYQQFTIVQKPFIIDNMVTLLQKVAF